MLLSNTFNQFITVDNNNLKDLFEKIGYSEEMLQSIPDKIEIPDIQKIRLPEITVFIEVDEEINDIRIPQFILQPIVENAYKHAFNHTNGSIWVEGKLKNGMVEFTVSDNGEGINPEALNQLNFALKSNEERNTEGGIGLINVQRRLKILMGESAHIKVESNEGSGTVVIISCGAMKGESDV